jgi:hypothetical protein
LVLTDVPRSASGSDLPIRIVEELFQPKSGFNDSGVLMALHTSLTTRL